MPNRWNATMALILLVALIIVLYTTGAGALLQQFVVTMARATVSFFQALIPK